MNLADSETAVRIVPLKCFIVFIIEDSILYIAIFLLCKTEIRTVNLMVRYIGLYIFFLCIGYRCFQQISVAIEYDLFSFS